MKRSLGMTKLSRVFSTAFLVGDRDLVGFNTFGRELPDCFLDQNGFLFSLDAALLDREKDRLGSDAKAFGGFWKTIWTAACYHKLHSLA